MCLPPGTLRHRRDRAQTTSHVQAFCMDRTLVTRARFADFVDQTHHRTSAERSGFGVESLEGFLDWEWRRAPGATWQRPSSVDNADTAGFLRDDAPVVMVSWHDANAYCAWAGGRLPTELEWEYAMRAGANDQRFPWGDSVEIPGTPPRLNRWEGSSHAHNDRRDGYVYVSPVTAFAPNRWGLYDPVGNVWQWTADTYRLARDTLDTNASQNQRVLRGGSWWCAACTCEGYGLTYRGHTDAGAAFSNNGFRCVYDRALSTHE
ncbi:MAG: SUMF1/EgtB/PvdO family nonheme iron enzyme [Deltaproteobacteria bacterium]|nr:SUMF1/EgtB/PvdO family nonheme iron enzyme [Deltaproteobacteria bacterium]